MDLQSSDCLAWKHVHNWEKWEVRWEPALHFRAILWGFCFLFVWHWPDLYYWIFNSGYFFKQWTLGLNPRSTETQWCPQTIPMPNLVKETLHQVATANSELFVQQVNNVYRFLHGIKSFGICFLSLLSPVQATRAGVGARGLTVGTEHRE